MLLKSLMVMTLVTSAAFASAASNKIETREGVQEIIKLLGYPGPGCAMGTCEAVVTDLQCGWGLDAVGKIQNACAFKEEQTSKQNFLAELDAYKLMAYAQLAGVKLDDSVAGLMQSPKIKSVKCKTVAALPEANRLESHVCEFF